MSLNNRIRFSTGCDLLDMVTGGDKGVYGFPAGRFCNVVGDRSSGKCQPLYTKVLTPDGWKTMGDIHVGDMVCTPDGGQAEVIGEFPQGKRKCYRFHLSDGTTVDSGDNHLWVVRDGFINDWWGIITTIDLDRAYKEGLYIVAVPVYESSFHLATNSLYDLLDELKNVNIDRIEYIGEIECKCIYINHPFHLYITDNYVVTHNTFLANEIIASAYHKYPRDKFRWVYDDCERGYSFDTQSMYGFDILPQDPEDVIASTTVEEAFCHISDFADSLEEDQFGIYVLDSLDGLTSEEQNAQADDRLKAFHNGKEYDKGSYGMGKPKYLSREFFPQLCSKIQDKNILVIIISQVRENIDMFSFEKFTRSGGKALDFYAHMVVWLATTKKIVKKDRSIGVVVKAKVTKGKVPRPFRECFFTLIYDYGLDNIGTSIDYLYDLRTPQGELSSKAKAIRWGDGQEKLGVVALKKWLNEENLMDTYLDSKYSSGNVNVDDVTEWATSKKEYLQKFQERFGMTMSRDELIQFIEDNNLQEELRQKVEEKWEALEDDIKSNRKKKYATQPEGE